MASTPVKDSGFTGALHLLLLGLLLPAVLVSGEGNSTTSPANMTTSSATSQPNTTSSGATNSTTQAPTSTTQSQTVITGASTSQSPSTASGATTMTTQSATTNINSPSQSASSTTSGGTAFNTTTQPLTTTATSGGTAVTTTTNTQTPSNTTPGGSSASITTTQPLSTTATSGASTTAMSQSSLATTTSGGMTNGTTFECPSFSCNKSECYSMYSSQNATWCSAASVCQLMRQMDMSYTVNCTASCADSCVNASQINCNENCCNSTGCLNSTFASMMNMTTASGNTTTMTPTSKPVTSTTATTPVNNGNKCNQGVCTGTDCYKAFKTDPLQTCSSSQPHCQLMKETMDSSLKWTAGCFSNCSAKTTCEASTPPPCHLECCNATSSSCLWLNGTMNVPSFATRGPSLHTEMMTGLLCLLAVTLML